MDVTMSGHKEREPNAKLKKNVKGLQNKKGVKLR